MGGREGWMEAAGERIVYFGVDVASLVALAASPSDSEKKNDVFVVCLCLFIHDSNRYHSGV